ncbi:MAG: hypothetical protein K8Q89_09315 [Nitrosarchaeum sp.]|nr:hypothetical protein [Nitrosarchaeum sp.]
MTENWKGVRPIRYSEDIFDVLDYLVSNNSTKIENLRILLTKKREEREKRRLTALQIRRTTESKIRKKEEFLTKTEQLIRVLLNLKLIKKEKLSFISTPPAKSIVELIKNGKKLDAQSKFLEMLFDSTYPAYLLFIKQLTKTPIIIPKEKNKRNKEFSDFLKKQNMFLDSWSFFVIRDLFYDFNLLNYSNKENEQQIFAVCTFDPKKIKFKQKIKTASGFLYNYPIICKTDFIKNLTESYLTLTDRRWGTLVNFLDLRENFTERFTISDNQFNELISESFSKTILSIKIVPSVGSIRPSERKSNMVKVLNLPMDKSGIPYTLIRMTKEM